MPPIRLGRRHALYQRHRRRRANTVKGRRHFSPVFISQQSRFTVNIIYRATGQISPALHEPTIYEATANQSSARLRPYSVYFYIIYASRHRIPASFFNARPRNHQRPSSRSHKPPINTAFIFLYAISRRISLSSFSPHTPAVASERP